MNPATMDTLMRKLYSIQRVLTPENRAQPIDKFESIKKIIIHTLTIIRNKTEEKEKKIARFGASLQTLEIEQEIEDKLEELNRQLAHMNQVLREQHKDHRKYGVNELMIKDQFYRNFLTQKEDLKAKGEVYHCPQIRTILDVRSDMPNGRDLEDRGPEREMTEEEASGLEILKKNDEQQEIILTEIVDGLETLGVKAKNIGVVIDQQDVGIDNLDTQMTKAILELEVSNNKLKQVLVKYRKPEKFCMDVCLLLVLLGLISVIVNNISG